ncbi:hypothetical protein HDU83_007269, partial [Entophlyctis luteolus]
MKDEEETKTYKRPPLTSLSVIPYHRRHLSTADDGQALTILNVHHGLKIIDSPEDWFVPLTASQPYPHTPYEAATDVASLFPRQLTAAYPDAEIVLVESDFGKWLREP